jgi:tetratricopeptide (TPR) repeat protein
VTQHDWYRRTTWSEADRSEFFARLKRSRGSFHKAQYLTIQAIHLQENGLYNDALTLLQIVQEQYGEEYRTKALRLRAECLWAVGEPRASFDAYLEALASQKKFPNIICGAALSFAERFHEYDNGAYRKLLLEELHDEIERYPFAQASSALRCGTVMVQLLTGLGETADAEAWQRIADEALRRNTIEAIRVTNPQRPASNVASGKRAKSELAHTLDEIQLELRTTLKAAGFRARGRAFNRTTSDGLIEVLSIWMRSFDPPGTAPIPGFQTSLYGKFTVNLGVYVPEVYKWRFSAEPRAFVPEPLCAIRQRLGNLGPEHSDTWWHIRRDPSLVDDLKLRLIRDAFPFFARFQSRGAILRECAQSNYDRMGCFETPPRIVCATILFERGQRSEARRLLAEQTTGDSNHGHTAYVRALAERMGLGSLDD